MLDDVIATAAECSPDAYRTEQAEYWTREADNCRAHGWHDLAYRYDLLAAVWLRQTEVRWEGLA